MLKVKVRRSAILIYPYTMGMLDNLEKALSVWDNIIHKYTTHLYDFVEEENSKSGVLKIPKGFGVDMICDMLTMKGVAYELIDESDLWPEVRKVEIPMTKTPRNQIQENSTDFLNETFTKLCGQAFLQLDTGVGKTFTCVNHASKKGFTTLVVSYNLTNQWIERIMNYTSLVSGKDVAPIIGTQTFKDIIDGKMKKPEAAFYITTTNTLVLMAQTYGKESLQKIADVLGIGIKIFDEAHTHYLMFNTIDLNMQTCETIYVTATPGRSNKTEDRLYGKIYRLVPSYGDFTSKLNNYYIVKYITYDSHSMARDRRGFKTQRGLSSVLYTKFLWKKWGVELCRMIMHYALPILKEDNEGKILIVTDQLQDIAFGKAQMEKEYPEYSVGTYCLLIKDPVLKEAQLEKRIIFGTLGAMQNGRDISNLRAIFPLSAFSSKIVTHQLLGRLRYIPNKYVYYFDFADISVYNTIEQRKERDIVLRDRAQNDIQTEVIDLERF